MSTPFSLYSIVNLSLYFPLDSLHISLQVQFFNHVVHKLLYVKPLFHAYKPIENHFPHLFVNAEEEKSS